MLDSILDFVTVFLPIIIAVVSVLVSIRLAKSQSHGGLWWIVLSCGVAASCLTLWQQSRSRNVHERELKIQTQQTESVKAELDKTQTKLDILSDVFTKYAANRPSGNKDTSIVPLLAAMARNRTPKTAEDRRAEAQAALAKLMGEGLKLTSHCDDDPLYEREATLQSVAPFEDWEQRTYTALAANVDPKQLEEFYSNLGMPPGQDKWLKKKCLESRFEAWNVANIMKVEFAKPKPQTQQ